MRVAGTPVAILAAAILPAALYAVLLARFDRDGPGRTSLLVATFLWGAVFAAWLATTLNALVPGWLSATGMSLDSPGPFDPVFAVPVVEELAKTAALLVVVLAWRNGLRDVRDGIVLGALVGLGFAASENVLYLTLAGLQAGYSGVVRGAYMRAILYGLNHAVFTATAGAALGYARETTSRVRALAIATVGLCGAVVQHALWNGVASVRIVEIVCAPLVTGGTCREPPSPWSLYVTVPMIVMAFVGPGAAVLAIAASRRRVQTRPAP